MNTFRCWGCVCVTCRQTWPKRTSITQYLSFSSGPVNNKMRTTKQQLSRKKTILFSRKTPKNPDVDQMATKHLSQPCNVHQGRKPSVRYRAIIQVVHPLKLLVRPQAMYQVKIHPGAYYYRLEATQKIIPMAVDLLVTRRAMYSTK
jgi:hypothetical protein